MCKVGNVAKTSVCDSSYRASSYSALQLYRICYLLNKDFNIWYSSDAMLFIQVGMTVFSVISLHVLIRFYDTLPVIMIAFLSVSFAVILLFVAIIYPIAADVHSYSKAFKQALIKATLDIQLKCDVNSGQNKYKQHITIRRQNIRSIALLKVEVGAAFMHKGKVCATYNSIIYWTLRSVILANKQNPN